MTVLNGKIAVVTGGGGGIGADIARRLASAGAKVAVIDLSGDNAEGVAMEIGGLGLAADIADEASVAECAAAVAGTLGAPDILVNCAAMFQAPAPPSSLRMERWDMVVQVALRGTYLTCAAFGEAMVRKGQGAIVNIASVAGMVSFPYHAYGPAKAGVISLTRNLAAEWGPCGVRVNAISPGFTLTPQMQEAIERGNNPVEPIIRGTPLGRLVEPREVSEAALFLVSPASSAITGVNLPVDCGWTSGVTWEPYGGLRPA
jgi:NAD(P)-dependent dehydrogenase (short-subunit alcohol dehydrogenase family)